MHLRGQSLEIRSMRDRHLIYSLVLHRQSRLIHADITKSRPISIVHIYFGLSRDIGRLAIMHCLQNRRVSEVFHQACIKPVIRCSIFLVPIQ